MGVLLARGATAGDLVRVASEVRNGQHGDTETWTAAEGSWQEGPLDLATAGSEPQHPFPLEVACWLQSTYAGDDPHPLQESFRSVHAVDRMRGAFVADAALWLLSNTKDDADCISPAQVGELIDATDPASRFLEIGILDRVQLGPGALASFLDGLPADTRFMPVSWSAPRPARDVVSELRFIVRDAPTPCAVDALACSLVGDERDSSHLAVPLDHPEVRACSSAAFVALRVGDRTVNARELGRRFGAVDDLARRRLLESSTAQRVADWDEFLVGVRESSASDMVTQRFLDGVMSEVLSRRSAPITEAAVWYALGLFEPHPLKLVRTG